MSNAKNRTRTKEAATPVSVAVAPILAPEAETTTETTHVAPSPLAVAAVAAATTETPTLRVPLSMLRLAATRADVDGFLFDPRGRHRTSTDTETETKTHGTYALTAESVKRDGVQVPLIVCPSKIAGLYVVADGRQRLQMALAALLADVPVVVRPFPASRAEGLKLIGITAQRIGTTDAQDYLLAVEIVREAKSAGLDLQAARAEACAVLGWTDKRVAESLEIDELKNDANAYLADLIGTGALPPSCFAQIQTTYKSSASAGEALSRILLHSLDKGTDLAITGEESGTIQNVVSGGTVIVAGLRALAALLAGDVTTKDVTGKDPAKTALRQHEAALWASKTPRIDTKGNAVGSVWPNNKPVPPKPAATPTPADAPQTDSTQGAPTGSGTGTPTNAPAAETPASTGSETPQVEIVAPGSAQGTTDRPRGTTPEVDRGDKIDEKAQQKPAQTWRVEDEVKRMCDELQAIIAKNRNATGSWNAIHATQQAQGAIDALNWIRKMDPNYKTAVKDVDDKMEVNKRLSKNK